MPGTYRRRDVLTAAAGLGGLAMPRIAAAQAARVLRLVPSVEIGILDPVLTTSTPTRNHAYLVFDTLYGLDSSFEPQPQMLEGHLVDAEFRDWTLRLREGLRFHDNEPVRAQDVVASLRPWGQRDALGRVLFALTDDLAAVLEPI